VPSRRWPPTRFDRDSARGTLKAADSTQTIAVAVRPDALPITSFSFALYQQAVRRARAIGGDSVPLQVVPRGADRAFDT
jgi:hypothetical protein